MICMTFDLERNNAKRSYDQAMIRASETRIDGHLNISIRSVSNSLAVLLRSIKAGLGGKPGSVGASWFQAGATRRSIQYPSDEQDLVVDLEIRKATHLGWRLIV